ncbi:MAG: intradiol ring-cleavage dioxygenase, partial [Rhizobacter sp.]|nr:intradiol ring-cleavage dioxygenase [Rhizobacter sp.]
MSVRKLNASAVKFGSNPNVTGYSQSVTNLARVTVANDNVFGDNTAAQVAVMTPTMTGG